MDEQNIIACICEGAAEHAIIDLLLENDLLYFKKQQLLDEKPIRVRSAPCFEAKYLRKQFSKKITILRILDSRRESFKLSEYYRDKVEVINIITAPEIEMLLIHSENRYEEFKRSGKKPSLYCKEDLKLANVKSYDFVKHYFQNVGVLLEAIRLYRKKSKIPKDEKTLFDLLSTCK